MMTHCLENRWRHDLVYSSFGTSSVTLYEDNNLLNSKTVLFHGVYMAEKDMAIVGQHRASVIHCPISNAVTGAGAANVAAMLREGINVGVGTDFDHTDMWEEMRMAYYLLKLQAPVEAFKAADVWRMATENGAKAYQLGDTIGQIKDGYEADLALIKKDTALAMMLNQENFSTYAHNLLMSCAPSSVHYVMVQGEWVMNDQKVIHVDEKRVLKRYEEIMQDLMDFIISQACKSDASTEHEA